MTGRLTGLLFFLAIVPVAFGETPYLRDNYRDIRWLGRGNTGVAIINDGSSIFYNPAGVASTTTFSFSILNPFIAGNQNFAQSILQAKQTFAGGGTKTLSQQLSPFLGSPLGAQGGVLPHASVPFFSAGFWDYTDSTFLYTDPVYPRLNVDARNDYGVFLASGYHINGIVFFGASLRYQKRKSISQEITADSLLTNTSSLLTQLLRTGEGFGLNVGMQIKQPVNNRMYLAFGAAVEDVGYTRFKNSNRYLLAPEPQAQAVNLGLAFDVKAPLLETTILLDVRRLTEANTSFTKKLFTGIELANFLANVRGGLFQGYWTAGFSLHALPFLDIDFATYAEEMGASAGQRQNRYWMIGLSSGMELKKVARKKQRFKLDNL